MKIKILFVADDASACKAFHIHEDGTVVSIAVYNGEFHSKEIGKVKA